jgi:hypothetical protein
VRAGLNLGDRCNFVSRSKKGKCKLIVSSHPQVPSIGQMLPVLKEENDGSTPSVPKESEHLPCHRRVRSFWTWSAPDSVKTVESRIWAEREMYANHCLGYRTEHDVQSKVTLYIRDCINALDLNLTIAEDFQVAGVKEDVLLILNNFQPVGSIKFKKPEKKKTDAVLQDESSTLIQPTVIGELCDQLRLVSSFYGSGPACGILMNGEEMVIAWESCDDDIMNRRFENDTVGPSRDFCLSPSKTDPRWVHEVEVERGDVGLVQVGMEDPDKRVLSTTDVLSMRDPASFDYICTALLRMSRVKYGHTTSSQCLFGIHAGTSKRVTWHPISREQVEQRLNKNNCPQADTTSLLILEDLGKGGSGRAWLACTMSFSAVCVIKFSIKPMERVDSELEAERDAWHAVYPAFKSLVRVNNWSGWVGLIMPHFGQVQPHERQRYYPEVMKALRALDGAGYVHNDVKWANMGMYLTAEGPVVILYDLGSVAVRTAANVNWIDKAVHKLYPDGIPDESDLDMQ